MTLTEAEGELVGMCLTTPYAMALCCAEWGFEDPPFHGREAADLLRVWQPLVKRWQNNTYDPETNDTQIFGALITADPSFGWDTFWLNILPPVSPVPEAEVDRVFTCVTEAHRLEDEALAAVDRLARSKFGLTDLFDNSVLLSVALVPGAAGRLADNTDFHAAYATALHQRHLRKDTNQPDAPQRQQPRPDSWERFPRKK